MRLFGGARSFGSSADLRPATERILEDGARLSREGARGEQQRGRRRRPPPLACVGAQAAHAHVLRLDRSDLVRGDPAPGGLDVDVIEARRVSPRIAVFTNPSGEPRGANWLFFRISTGIFEHGDHPGACATRCKAELADRGLRLRGRGSAADARPSRASPVPRRPSDLSAVRTPERVVARVPGPSPPGGRPSPRRSRRPREIRAC